MSKTVIVTGASRGIGAVIARAFAESGYNTVINYHTSEKRARDLEKELCDLGYSAKAVRADMKNSEEIKSMLELTYQTFGSVDVLVCNAGISKIALLGDHTDDDIYNIMSVNIGGVIKSCREAIPYMLKNHNGSIVTVSSMWGSCGASCETVYSASKSAVIGFTKALAKELGTSGIRVNCVCPGVIDTEMNSELGDDIKAQLVDETPLCRIGQPEDAANAVMFLASDKASFITGQILGVNGGFVI